MSIAKNRETEGVARYALIDDDASFRTILKRAAGMQNINIDVFESLDQLGAVGLLSRYDVVIVDYDLGESNGVDIGGFLDIHCKDTPMILVSAKDRRSEAHSWPKSIQQFIPKTMGYSYILDQAERCAQYNKIQRPKFLLK